MLINKKDAETETIGKQTFGRARAERGYPRAARDFPRIESMDPENSVSYMKGTSTALRTSIELGDVWKRNPTRGVEGVPRSVAPLNDWGRKPPLD